MRHGLCSTGWWRQTMHELSICRALVAQVTRCVSEHQARGAARITLRIGVLAGVEAQLLRETFPLAAAGSVAQGAEVAIEEVPLRVRCDRCGAVSDAQANRLLCGVCGDWHTRLVSGDEMVLASVELVK